MKLDGSCRPECGGASGEIRDFVMQLFDQADAK
jgi:hypothetical protein